VVLKNISTKKALFETTLERTMEFLNIQILLECLGANYGGAFFCAPETYNTKKIYENVLKKKYIKLKKNS